MIENAAKVGKHLGKRLEEIKAKHPSVGDVRYIGLFSVIETVKNKATKEPTATRNAKGAELAKMKEVGKYLSSNGVFTYISANMIFIVPPLVITEKELDEGLAVIDKALEITDAVCTK